MSRKFTITVTLLAILAGVWGFYRLAEWASRGGEESPLYSTRRHDPYGTAAIFDLLRERGVPVHTLERSRLESTDRGVLIQVISSQSGFGPPPPTLRSDELMEWISEGNTVIQFTRQPTELMDKCGIKSMSNVVTLNVADIMKHEQSGKPPDATPGLMFDAAWANAPDPNEDEDVDVDVMASDLFVRAPMVLADSADRRWHSLATTRVGTVAGRWLVGRGQLFVIGSPTPILNSGLGDRDNLTIMLSLIGDGPVIIDEWSHGIGQGGTVMEMIRRVGLLPALLQIAFAVGLYTWSTRGHRPRDIDEPSRARSSVEQIETLGYLYSQSLKADTAHGLVTQAVRKRLADALRCRPAEVEKRAKLLKPELAAKLGEISDALRSTERETAPLCRECGYDLTGNTSGACPECKAPIPLRMRERIASEPLPQPRQSRPRQKSRRYEAELARVLSLSSEFVTEATRARNTQR